MMKNLKAKLNKQGGFTLIEMLIVVAIIAILIAISIPMVNAALERSREATDAANERAALGMAMVEVLSDSKLGTEDLPNTGTISAYYKIDNSKGTLVKTKGTDATFKYGKGTSVVGDSSNPRSGEALKNLCVKITYDVGTGDFTATWE